MSRPARIKTAKDAYNDGFAVGSDGSGMSGGAWPSQDDFNAGRRDPLVAAWMRGFSDGRSDRLGQMRPAWSIDNPKRKTMKRRKLRRAGRRGGRTMTVTTSSRVVKTTRMNPSYGSNSGFNIATARLTDGTVLFLTRSGKWKPIADVGRFKPAQFRGGIPNVHYDRLIRSNKGNSVAQFTAEPWPEMPNLTRRGEVRSNPRGLSLEPYRRNFRFGRDRHFENIDHSPSSKNIRSMMRVLFPRWTKEQHVERLIALSRLIHVAGGVWGRIADKAHAETFPGKRRGFADYKVSGVGRDEYPERLKGRLRIAARAESTITRAIHAHAMLAGKAALRRAGITEAAMSSYRNNPGGDRFKKTAEFMSDDGTHSFRAGKNLDAGTWDDRLYVDTGTGFKHKPEFGYDGHDSAADAAAAAKANRDWHDGKRSTRPNPHDARTATTQRLPMIRATIPAGGGKDPRTAETRRLRVVTSAHRKNPVRTLAVPRTMWNHLKRADKRVKHGHRYVRCKTRRARRAFWLPCTVR